MPDLRNEIESSTLIAHDEDRGAREHAAAAQLEAALVSLGAIELDADFAVAAKPIRVDDSCWPGTRRPLTLPPELRAASERRRASYLSGRACAYRALQQLCSRADSIPIGEAGAPVWPSGFVGSITHANGVAAAIVVRSPPLAGIGLDYENSSGVDDPAMVELICRPEEDLRGVDAADPARLRHAKLLFVIKEAVYKAHRPLGGAFLDFHDVHVLMDAENRFVAELVDARKQGRAGTRIRGRILRGADWLAAVALCRSSGIARPAASAAPDADTENGTSTDG